MILANYLFMPFFLTNLIMVISVIYGNKKHPGYLRDKKRKVFTLLQWLGMNLGFAIAYILLRIYSK